MLGRFLLPPFDGHSKGRLNIDVWKLPARPSRRRRERSAAALEVLENRTLLAGFTVNSLLDTPDETPGDGRAEDSLGRTTLRAAIMEAEASPGADVITFSIGAGGTIERGAIYPTITEDLRIIGPGADLLILDANGVGRGFTILNSDPVAESTPVVEIVGMTITGGLADAMGGGGVGNFGGDLTLRGVRITGNGTLTPGLMTPGGGVMFAERFINPFQSGRLTIIDSLIDQNMGSAGGGISFGSTAGEATIINTTISGNMAGAGDGGGIHYTQNATTLVLRNVTITGNRVLLDAPGSQVGGGIFVQTQSAGPLPFLFNTLVAGNTAGTATVVPDDINSTTVGVSLIDATSSFNLVGDAASAGGLMDGVLGNIVGIGGAGTIPIATILEALSDNGGTTLTHKLATGSLAIDAGLNSLALNELGGALGTDQRGPGFGRIINGDGVGGATVDIGAFEAPPGSGGPSNPDDIIGKASSGTLVLARSTGTSFTNSVVGGISPSFDWGDNLLYADFGSNGVNDAAGFSPTDGMWRVLSNNGVSGFGPAEVWATWQTTVPYLNFFTGDFNGDGIADVMGRTSNGYFLVGLSDETSFVTTIFGAWSPFVMWQDVRVGDFNGDGRTDVAGRAPSGSWVVGTSTGSSFAFSVYGAWATVVSWQNVQTADVNGDGRDDIIGRASSGRWVVAVSNGTTFTNRSFGGWSTAVSWSDVLTGDFNADGNADIVGRASTGTIVVGLSTGTSYAFSVFGGASPAISWSQVQVGDFDGDGDSDLAMRAATGTWLVGVSNGSSFAFTVWGGWSSFVSWDAVEGGPFTLI